MTLGARGSFIVTPDLIEHVAAVEVAGPVDPAGAGDTFSVAYLTRRANGAEPRGGGPSCRRDGRHASRKRVRRQEAVRLSLARGALQPELSPGDDDSPPADLDALDSGIAPPSARAYSVDGRSRLPGRSRSRFPHGTRPCLQTWHASGHAEEPVAGSSGTTTPARTCATSTMCPNLRCS